MVEKALQSRRRAINRHIQLLPHHGDRHVHVRHPTQDRWQQITPIKRPCVFAVSHLIIRAAVNIVEDRPRQAALGQSAEILKVMTVLQTHDSSSLIGDGWQPGGKCGPQEYKRQSGQLQQDKGDDALVDMRQFDLGRADALEIEQCETYRRGQERCL